ncbi:MAG: glycosyltransferase domain-containing protein [bacterium]
MNKRMRSSLEKGVRNLSRSLWRQLLERNNVVVYTAIIGGIDKLLPPLFSENSVRMVCFSDKKMHNSYGWELFPAETPFDSPRMNAKRYKILAHEIFPDADYSIWLDGTFQMALPPREAIMRWLASEDIAMMSHPERTCIYQEAEVCAKMKKDDPRVLERQVKKYREEGYPENFGLVANGVVLRRHTRKISKLNQAWWEEIKNHSIRDQVSFNYVAWKLGINYSLIPGECWNNPIFPYTRHTNKCC